MIYPLCPAYDQVKLLIWCVYHQWTPYLTVALLATPDCGWYFYQWPPVLSSVLQRMVLRIPSEVPH